MSRPEDYAKNRVVLNAMADSIRFDPGFAWPEPEAPHTFGPAAVIASLALAFLVVVIAFSVMLKKAPRDSNVR